MLSLHVKSIQLKDDLIEYEYTNYSFGAHRKKVKIHKTSLYRLNIGYTTLQYEEQCGAWLGMQYFTT